MIFWQKCRLTWTATSRYTWSTPKYPIARCSASKRRTTTKNKFKIQHVLKSHSCTIKTKRLSVFFLKMQILLVNYRKSKWKSISRNYQNQICKRKLLLLLSRKKRKKIQMMKKKKRKTLKSELEKKSLHHHQTQKKSRKLNWKSSRAQKMKKLEGNRNKNLILQILILIMIRS